MPSVHPRDIAAVAACALTSDGHEGKEYPLTGPEAINVREQVHIVAEVTGREIEYVPVTDDVARMGMEKAGMPGFLIDALLPFVDAECAAKAGFETSKHFGFKPFKPTLPFPLGDFISTAG